MSDDDRRGLIDPGSIFLRVDEVIAVHETIIAADPEAEPGIKNPGTIDWALDHVEHGAGYEEGPETLHEKAFQLMRYLAAGHPFVDGNKRTALASAVLFYAWNEIRLEYQEELEAMLILLSIREDLINPEAAAEYLETITTYQENLFLEIIIEGVEEFIPDFDAET